MDRAKLEDIVTTANRLAGLFLGRMGFTAPTDFRFDQSDDPRSQLCWRMAMDAYQILTQTNPEDVISELESEVVQLSSNP